MLHNVENNELPEIEGVSLVDFWAPWCGPCRMIAPVLDELSEKYNVVKINTDANQKLAIKYSIRSVPTILIMKDGEIKETIIGAKDKGFLEDAIRRAQ